MRNSSILMLAVLLLLGLVLVAPAAVAQDSDVVVLTVEGPVTPAMADYFQRGIARAEAENATAVVIELDTPGGLVDTTQEIIQLFRASSVPVIVYVTPTGAQAASAGALITIAGHASGMAPGTVIGAASPVGDGGAELDETIARKIKEDLKATTRNLTADRAAEATALAEEMIETARAVTAVEALDAGLIDAVAVDTADLLTQLDGLPVVVDGETRTLNTAVAAQQPFEMSFIERLLMLLVNPLIVGILLTIGVQAILIELSNPGGWVAGVIGVIAIGLALYGLGQMPVNWLGLGLIILAFVLFFMEIKATVHGALALTGTALLIAGLLVLFNAGGAPEMFRLSLPAALIMGGATALFFLFVVGKAVGAQRRQPATGAEGLIGQTGPARTNFASGDDAPPYSGMVLVAGELWQARAEEPISNGRTVIVKSIDGMVLHVAQL